MTVHRGSRALMAFQGIAAVGIVVWWGYWFVSGSDTRGSACGLAYENSFPLADLVLAGALLATAFAIHRRHPAVVVLGGLAAGMAFSLATLDTTHNLLTGGFNGPLATTFRKAVFAVVNGSVGLWTVVWVHRTTGGVPSPPRWMGRPVTWVALVSVGAALIASAFPDGCSGALTGSGLGWAGLVVVLGMAARAQPSAVLLGALIHGGLVAALGRWL